MTNHPVRHPSRADRKARLLLDGTVCRIGIVQAKTTLAHSLRAENLIQGAIAYVFAPGSAVQTPALALSGSRVEQALLPLVAALLSCLQRKNLVKPAIGAGIAAAAVIAITALAERRRR